MPAFSSIKIQNLRIKMQGIAVLDNVTFTLQPGGHLVVIGASGSGKTLLAKALAGKLFSEGTLLVDYNKDSLLPAKAVLVEQRYQFKNLSNVTDFYYQQRFNSCDAEDAYTVTDELHEAIALQPNKEALKTTIDTWLTQLGMQHRKDAPIIQLSSGEHKRFQLIKAFINPPQLLILDSPFIGLDIKSRKQLMHIIDAIAANGTQVIIITDAHQLPGCITHIASLENGTLNTFEGRKNFNPEDHTHHNNYPHFNIQSLPALTQQATFTNAVKMVNTSVEYGSKLILDNINWQVNRGDKWLLKGHNGAGKSTLLSLITGDNPQAYANEIYLFDERRGSGESIWDIKKKIGYVSPEFHAFFDKNITCYQAVASGFFDTVGLYRKLSSEQHNSLQQWLDFLRVSSHVQQKPLALISTGGQRLILLARALVKNPPLLILDEPCQGLDDDQKEQFVQLVNDLCEQLDKTLIYVSHYENEIPQCIDKVLQLDHGKPNIYSIKKQAASAVQQTY